MRFVSCLLLVFALAATGCQQLGAVRYGRDLIEASFHSAWYWEETDDTWQVQLYFLPSFTYYIKEEIGVGAETGFFWSHSRTDYGLFSVNTYHFELPVLGTVTFLFSDVSRKPQITPYVKPLFGFVYARDNVSGDSDSDFAPVIGVSAGVKVGLSSDVCADLRFDIRHIEYDRDFGGSLERLGLFAGFSVFFR